MPPASSATVILIPGLWMPAAVLLPWQWRLQAAGYPFNETHHGYCMSLYVTSPDDFTMEFAYDAQNSPQIFEERAKADPHRELRDWLAGNRTPNNHWRDQKIR